MTAIRKIVLRPGEASWFVGEVPSPMRGPVDRWTCTHIGLSAAHDLQLWGPAKRLYRSGERIYARVRNDGAQPIELWIVATMQRDFNVPHRTSWAVLFEPCAPPADTTAVAEGREPA